MLQSFVEKYRHTYIVKTGTVTPRGFVHIRKTGAFNTLQEANAKTKLNNYIFGKISKLAKRIQEEY